MVYVIVAKSTYGDILRIVTATSTGTLANSIVNGLNDYVAKGDAEAIKIWDNGFERFSRGGLEYHVEAVTGIE